MAVFFSFSAWQTYQPSSGGAPSACAHLKIHTHTHTLLTQVDTCSRNKLNQTSALQISFLIPPGFFLPSLSPTTSRPLLLFSHISSLSCPLCVKHSPTNNLKLSFRTFSLPLHVLACCAEPPPLSKAADDWEAFAWTQLKQSPPLTQTEAKKAHSTLKNKTATAAQSQTTFKFICTPNTENKDTHIVHNHKMNGPNSQS